MLGVTQLSGFGGGRGVATVSFTDNSVDTGDLTVYTFSTQSLGTAANNRKIAVAVAGVGLTRVVSSLTIAGISATLVVAQDATDSCEIWQADVPTGTTGDVVVTWDAGQQLCGIGVFAIFGAKSGAFDTGGSTAVDPASDTLNIPYNGVAIGGTVLGSLTDRSFTWSNLTEQYDQIIESGSSTHTGASTSTSGSPTITCTPSGAGARAPVMALASWAAN